jgi:hypothetical protein
MPKTLSAAGRRTALLTELGSTADAVADTLRAAQIRGQRAHPGLCPIAQYLAQKAPSSLRDVVVLGSWPYKVIAYVSDLEQPYEQRIEVLVPPPVETFIDRFDKRDPRYGDLAR